MTWLGDFGARAWATAALHLPADCDSLARMVAGSSLQAPAQTSAIDPSALGLGLRPRYYPYLFEHWPEVDYFEIIGDNFFGAQALPQRNLSRVLSRYRVVIHTVGLNLLGHAGPSEDYVDQLCRLAERTGASFVSDHLCWTGAHGLYHHDLLPMPYTDALVELAASRAAKIQQRLGCPFGIENLSSYVEFRESTMSEAEFYTKVVQASGCWFMLDINNIYVSSVNHGFSSESYLDAIDFSRVLQIHLAGHSREASGTIVDTHDQPICGDVWQLYRHACMRHGPRPTLIEWDANIPEMPVVLAELARAKEVRK